jgi:hypothetical protein
MRTGENSLSKTSGKEFINPRLGKGEPLRMEEIGHQYAMLIEFPGEIAPGTSLGMYRPEQFIGPYAIHEHVPVPQELYRDVAFHILDRTLDWDLTAPVKPWTLKDDDRGTIRPYWENIREMQIYHYTKALLTSHLFWQRLAVLDYIGGLYDRTYNDVLALPAQHEGEEERAVVIDNGLSFLPGLDFVYDKSLIRDILRSQPLDRGVMADLLRLKYKLASFGHKVQGTISDDDLQWVAARIDRLLAEKKVV